MPPMLGRNEVLQIAQRNFPLCSFHNFAAIAPATFYHTLTSLKVALASVQFQILPKTKKSRP